MKANSSDYSCKMCGRCCYQDIPLTIYDIHRIARELGTNDEKVFEQCVAEKTVPKANIFAIKKKDNGSCILLNADNKCTIHAFKPRVCGFYPCLDVLERDKELWRKLYLSSDTFENFWEHSMAENYTKIYIERFGTSWNEEGYLKAINDIERCVIAENGEKLCVACDDTGLPMAMKYNCEKCIIYECHMETEITLLDISRIANALKTSIQSVFKTAVSKQPHSYTGGLKLLKNQKFGRCVYFDEKKHCTIYQYRPRFCQFEPCGLKVSDETTWKRFFFAAGDIEEQWEIEISTAVTRKYVKYTGTRYNRTAFDRYVKEINTLMRNKELKSNFLRNIRQYRYDEIPIQPLVHTATSG